jgi:hypothetical protein
MVILFCAWLRRFFDIDERRLRLRLYLHQGLDLGGAMQFWSSATDIPLQQFRTPYRAAADEVFAQQARAGLRLCGVFVLVDGAGRDGARAGAARLAP